jgi:hypothetical protein
VLCAKRNRSAWVRNAIDEKLQLLRQGKASPEQLQSANSLFGGRANRFQIVDYGGLDE